MLATVSRNRGRLLNGEVDRSATHSRHRWLVLLSGLIRAYIQSTCSRRDRCVCARARYFTVCEFNMCLTSMLHVCVRNGEMLCAFVFQFVSLFPPRYSSVCITISRSFHPSICLVIRSSLGRWYRDKTMTAVLNVWSITSGFLATK